ncbi:MAG: hypothetical protein QME05_00540 [Candidatus Margulisbacteria bacterium]|nr:hypothetical protein [Candidatus Margulisiibacteriota bacterium]
MVKRLLGLGACLAVALMVVGGSVDALVSVGALAANYSAPGGNVSGYGLEVEIPLLPLLTTRVDATFASGTNAGGTYNITPVMLNGSYKFPLTPIYVGAGVGTALFTQVGVTVPSTVIYDVFLGYEQGILPMSSVFIQAGSMNMILNYSIGGVTINQNMSGTSVKGGVRFGI